MIPKPTLQSRPLECLLEILKYVPLPECMFLRSSCASFKYAVDEHFRKDIRTLPVMLSDHYSAESVDKYQKYCENNNTSRYQQISFGSTSGVSQWNSWEDEKMLNLDRIRHFRRDNYMILTDMTKFGAFVDFVTKYLPKITKLALVIDHPDHAHNIPEMLNIYQRQLKVLLLERTLRATLMFDKYCDIIKRVVPADNRKFDFTREIYDSVDSLEALKELYFFNKRELTFRLGRDGRGDDHRFVESMFRKLRVLHLNCDGTRTFGMPFNFRSEAYGKLEELACYSSYSFRENKISFPRLEKLIFFESYVSFHHLQDSNLLPNLREISLPNSSVSLMGDMRRTMDSIPNLKRLHFHKMSSAVFPFSKFRSNIKTVEFIEIDKLFEDPKDSMEIAMQKARDFLGFFPNLKKAVIQEPFMELAGSDLPLKESKVDYLFRHRLFTIY